ncbi:MAG: biotin--[acetyl-CoA-carboxylase] ligase [Acidiferrobacteraceae bacterium]
MSHRAAVLALLADGQFHSGPGIGDALGITRAAVHKIIERVEAEGVVCERRRGRGYRLDPRFHPLSSARIAQYWPQAPLSRLDLLHEIDSTSRHLLRETDRGVEIHGRCCLAESQTQGAGRTGRRWIATAYSNILLSCAWRFDVPVSQLGGLSLAAGVAARSALVACGLDTVLLKWPNDLVCGAHKLGGILLDVRAQGEAPALVVCGVGVNVFIAPADGAHIDQPWTDMTRVLGAPVDRNRVAAELLRHLTHLFVDFSAHGFARWQAAWEQHHRDTGRRVCVIDPTGRSVSGEALGTDAQGGLRLREAGQVHTVYAGEVGVIRESPDRSR